VLRAAVAFAGTLLIWTSSLAGEGSDKAALEDLQGYRVLRSSADWSLYLKSNTLDIWRGNPPYEHLKTGHATLALVWKSPVALPGHASASYARSASISYVFSCSPPRETSLAKVIFFSTAFIPRNDTIAEQWHTMRSTVETIDEAQDPSDVSWGAVFDGHGRADWNRVWKEIYSYACQRG
jgi:hypothetical protein